MTETEFLAQILEVAVLYGWEGAHFRPAQTARGWRTPVQGSLGKGWPDLVLIRKDRLVVAELKVASNLSPAQTHVLDTFRGVAEVYLWRPADFAQIVETLR